MINLDEVKNEEKTFFQKVFSTSKKIHSKNCQSSFPYLSTILRLFSSFLEEKNFFDENFFVSNLERTKKAKFFSFHKKDNFLLSFFRKELDHEKSKT